MEPSVRKLERPASCVAPSNSGSTAGRRPAGLSTREAGAQTNRFPGRTVKNNSKLPIT
jgi:hypothetical protein